MSVPPWRDILQSEYRGTMRATAPQRKGEKMESRRERQHRPNLLLGAAAGALGGIAGSWAMIVFNHAVGGTENGERPQQHRRNAASPNETDSTISDEPASMQIASLAGEHLTGAPIGERAREVGGSLVHYAFGAAVGALYGAAAEYRPDTAALGGLPFGTGVWVAADEVGLPLLGLAHNPTEYPASRHLAAFTSHVVFGLTAEAVRRQLRGR
jgi:putative membrane protein